MDADKKVFDIRFIYFMPEIDLMAVIKSDDDMASYSSKLQSFIDMGPGFKTFISDPVNRRNATTFAAGVAVLKNALTEVGCTMLMLSVAQLEGAVLNRNTELRDELIIKIPENIEKLCDKLKTIPRVEMLAQKISDSLEAESNAEATRKKSVLVIDDALVCLGMVESLLQTWFNVYAISKSETYEQILQKAIVDLFLLDVEMPGLDGYQLLEAIRKMPAYKETPVIFLTGHATPSNLKMAMGAGINGFIRKPFEADLLVDRVCMAMANANLRTYTLANRQL